MAELIRNYIGLSRQQVYTFRLVYEDFQYKSTTVFKDGPSSITFYFPNQASMKAWDELMKKEGLG